MPLYDFLCTDCGKMNEFLVTSTEDSIVCPSCGGSHLKKLLSAHSSLSGVSHSRIPGHGDTACCGTSPSQASCAGPGSCCGKGPF